MLVIVPQVTHKRIQAVKRNVIWRFEGRIHSFMAGKHIFIKKLFCVNAQAIKLFAALKDRSNSLGRDQDRKTSGNVKYKM